MDEREFRRMLDLFPVVRSRDYCAESVASSKGTTQQSRAQEATEENKKEPSDQFMRKLKMAAEKKVYKELNLDAAQRFLNAYEKRP
uniref:Uncharacterized protein n=1 Tax=Leersia perrieri TaxID=77586 RepID=A0A0D9X233_9ORYZ